jgi:alpha-1,2-mannosyltransferase
MLHALTCFRGRLPIYQTVFFTEHDKFQYPLTSLLPLYWLQLWGLSNAVIMQAMNVLTWLAVWITLALSARILLFAANRYGVLDELKGQGAPVIAASVGLLGLFFYPLMIDYALGQIQTLLVMLFAGVVYLWLKERYKMSGALIGLMCLIKPQYSLFLVWLALRKKFGALVSAALMTGVGWLFAGTIFGWREQLAYLDVLRYISKHGEPLWLNESMNGLLNHLLFNGPILEWKADAFAPYNPFIYVASTAFSVGLIALALFYPHTRRNRGGLLDLGTMAITATIASPIAWHQHYSILLPVFAFLAGSMSKSRYRLYLAAAFVVTSNSWSPLALVANVPVVNALLSLRFFAALLLLYVLYRESGVALVPDPSARAKGAAFRPADQERHFPLHGRRPRPARSFRSQA